MRCACNPAGQSGGSADLTAGSHGTGGADYGQRAVGIDGAHDHALRFDTHHLAGLEVCHETYFLADKLGWILIALGDAAEYHAFLHAVVDQELKQFLRLLDLGAFKYFADTDIDLLEVIERAHRFPRFRLPSRFCFRVS